MSALPPAEPPAAPEPPAFAGPNDIPVLDPAGRWIVVNCGATRLEWLAHGVALPDCVRVFEILLENARADLEHAEHTEG